MTIRTPRRSAIALGGALCAVVLSFAATAQQPTEEERSAIRQSCRSDFIAHCSSVQPGGREALECLQSNSASLSGACRAAIGALSKPAAEPAPAAKMEAAPKTEAPPEQPSQPAPAVSAPRQPTAAAPPPAPSGSPPRPPTMMPPPGASAGLPPPSVSSTLPPPGAPMPQLRPRMEVLVLRACAAERQTVCNLPPGGGRIIACLVANEATASPRCQGALAYARTN